MRFARASALVGVSLALLVFPARAAETVTAANETVVVWDGSSFLTETLAGTVVRTTSLCDPLRGCLWAWHFGTPAHDGTIVFRTSDTGQPGVGIWLVSPSGELRQLTSDIHDDYPAIAPDGSLVAFDRYDPSDGHADIYTIKPDGSGLTLVAGGKTQNRSPAFSPDGTTIAYWCGLPQPANGAVPFGAWCGPTAGGTFAMSGLMLMTRDGGGKRMIARYIGREPAWSPDGARIVLADATGEARTTQIYVVHSDGRDLSGSQPVSGPSDPPGFAPNFSSDGGSILFGSGTWQGQNGNFFLLMNANGSGLQQLSLRGNVPARFVPPATGGAVPPTVDVEHAFVPQVQTMGVTAAKRTLRSAGCSVGSITRRYSRTIRRGRVISQRPRAGVRVRRGAKVNLVVSRGARR
jgi:Tol biopolymer transport system component